MGHRRALQLSFTVRQCRVTVGFPFFALLCALSLCDRSGMLLTGLSAALLHEAGHLTAMLLIPGQAPASVAVTPFGIRIGRRPLSSCANGCLTVLAAGSAVNLLVGALTLPFFPRLAALHLVTGGMYLLPVDTLDGGGILRLLLARFLPERAAEGALTVLSLLTLTALSLLGVTVLCRTRYNFTLLGMSLWLLLSLLLRLSGHSPSDRHAL